MDNQIIVQPNNNVPAIQEPRSILEAIAAAVSNPSIDPDKMTALLDIQVRIMAIEREKSFNVYLAALQGKIPRITKHGKVDYTNKAGQRTEYSHERYEDIDAELRPLLEEYGFSYIFIQTDKPGQYKGTILHKDGHSMSGFFDAEPDNSGGKNSIQAVGSTRSYVRRYIFIGLLNIVTIGDDDDAQTFSYITPVQVAQIEERIANDGIDTERFLKNIGVDSVEHLPASMFETTIRAINERAAKKALKGNVEVPL